MSVRVSGKLPTDDKNGLNELVDDFTDNPHGRYLMVGVVSAMKVTRDIESGEEVPTIRLLRAEACHPDSPEAAALWEVLESLYGGRTGKWPLTATDDPDHADDVDDRDEAE